MKELNIFQAVILFLISAFSQAVVVDRTVYVSGQIGFNPETMKLVGEDVQEQAKQALTNIGHILEEAGSSFANVVKTTVLLADIKDYPKVNEIYATFFSSPHPARAAFQVGALPANARVEIEAIAVRAEIKDE
jgi:reactive intermediate/imine deaminase